MKPAPLLAALALLSPPQDALSGDPVPGSAFVEIETAKGSFFVHEPLRLRIRFGFEKGFLDSNLVPLFAQSLDLPVQLDANGIRRLPGTIPVADRDSGSVVFALNEGRGAATREERTRGGKEFAIFQWESLHLPERAGDLTIPAPRLRFAYATSFREDFALGRVALDRHEASVEGQARTLRILPLPEEGKPTEFAGAVGRFSASAALDRRSFGIGESFRCTLRIEGEGNLELFEAPSLVGLPGFHARGKIEKKDRSHREVVYDLIAVEPVAAFPPIRFAFFDPAPAEGAPPGYRVLQTESIPVEIRAGKAPPVEPEKESGAPAGAVAYAALGIAAAAFFFHRRKRKRAQAAPAGGNAASVFRERIQSPNADLAQVFAAYLAQRLQCPPAAVISGDLDAKLARAGIPADLAARAASLLDRLVAARYGGAKPADPQREAIVLVEEIERL